WRLEREDPGHTRSWYLQNCRFHIQHCLASGRSLDSPKRAQGNGHLVIDGVDGLSELAEHHTNGELFEIISFRDSVLALAIHLKPKERLVLFGLAEGYPLREIASRHNFSYPSALKYRRRIAALSIKMAISPPRAEGKKDVNLGCRATNGSAVASTSTK